MKLTWLVFPESEWVLGERFLSSSVLSGWLQKTIRVKSGPLAWSCEWGAACKIGEMDLTLRKLHLSKALNGWWNAFTFNKNMVLLPYTFVSCWRHAENVTWRIPAEENIRNYLVLSLMQTHMIWQINGEWKSAHLVFIGSSYVIPLAISFTDIRADKDIEQVYDDKYFLPIHLRTWQIILF